MTYAAITGWGKCMPPAVLSNADLATFVDTTDEWIMQRTGIHERRVSHVSGLELSYVAASRALACAGIAAGDIDLIIYGSCSNDEQIPNTASGLSLKLGAGNAAAMDINTACTSFLYGLSTATAMILTGIPMARVCVTVQRYGNMSGATVPVALVDALEEGRVRPGKLLLTPAFGGGLTFCSHVIRWGDRVTPIAQSDVELPPCRRSALEMARDYM